MESWGGYLYDEGGLKEALPHCELAARLSPRSELAARQFFHVLYDLGKTGEALEELRRFHRDTPSAEFRREWADLIREVEERLEDTNS